MREEPFSGGNLSTQILSPGCYSVAHAMPNRVLYCLLFAPILFLLGEEVTVDLRNPSYLDGTLKTLEGGVIQNEDIRIQAREIEYTHKKKEEGLVHTVLAKGDLLIQYKKRAYVGSSFEYDFESKTGFVLNGKTTASMWFVGGEVIMLKDDGGYEVQNVSITTCENKDSSWDFYASSLGVNRKNLFEAKNIRGRVMNVPFLWFPSFKLNLKKFKEPIFRYTINWDKGQGPRAAIRYQFYSWEDFALYGRLEYRWKTGFGGSLETEYFPENKRTTFVTRSYIGVNRLQTAPDKARRYRLQGAFKSVTESGKTETKLIWDKYNDVRMPTIFRPDDFEVDTAKQSLFYVRHEEDYALGFLKVRPKLNPFESIKQDLPTLYGTLLPSQIGNLGIYNFSSLKMSYVDFSYSSQLVQNLKNFHSTRIELKEKLIRPLRMGPLTATPYVGVNGIFYGNSQNGSSKALGVLSYGLDFFLRGEKTYQTYKHIVEPYLSFSFLTRPTVEPEDHYIFSISDGYQKINQIQIGTKTALFSKERPKDPAFFTLNLFANAFFKDPTIPQFIPRMYLYLDWRLPSLFCSLHNAWNFRHNQVEFINARLKWTVSENVAFTVEGRYRSKYNWRKADQENFILDVSRSETELLRSPLSDRRITFLSNLFIRFNPLWDFSLSTINGLYRENEKPYTEVRGDLATWISSSFRIHLNYSHIRYDDRVSLRLELMKKPSL